MNQAALKGFQMLADRIPSAACTVTVKEADGNVYSYTGRHYPLSGSVEIADIVCPLKELGRQLRLTYDAELIEVKF